MFRFIHQYFLNVNYLLILNIILKTTRSDEEFQPTVNCNTGFWNFIYLIAEPNCSEPARNTIQSGHRRACCQILGFANFVKEKSLGCKTRSAAPELLLNGH